MYCVSFSEKGAANTITSELQGELKIIHGF